MKKIGMFLVFKMIKSINFSSYPRGLLKRVNCFIILLFSLSSGNAFSMDFEACSVEEIVLAGSVNAHVRLDCVISNTPTCAVANTYFSFDKSTESGKQYLSLAMTAFAANMKVSGFIEQGEGTCPAWQPNVALLTHLRATK